MKNAKINEVRSPSRVEEVVSWRSAHRDCLFTVDEVVLASPESGLRVAHEFEVLDLFVSPSHATLGLKPEVLWLALH